MGNKKDIVWVCELFCDKAKSELLKIYEFATMAEISYVLNLKASMVSNFYHGLIKARGVLEYLNIYQRHLVAT